MPFDKAVESVERFVIRFEVHMVIGYEEISPKALFVISSVKSSEAY
jgi:hypothetical protein